MPVQPAVGGQRAFEVDRIARSKITEGASGQGLGHHVGGEPVVVAVHHRQADAVDGDRGAQRDVVDRQLGADPQACRIGRPGELGDLAEFLDDAGLHRRQIGSY